MPQIKRIKKIFKYELPPALAGGYVRFSFRALAKRICFWLKPIFDHHLQLHPAKAGRNLKIIVILLICG